LVDGEVGCIWGLRWQNILCGKVYIWLYLTRIGEHNTLRFVKGSRELIDVLSERYTLITGHVDPRMVNSKRWLKWLGFEFGEEHTVVFGDGKFVTAQVFWKGER
jgi:hypothetical protein